VFILCPENISLHVIFCVACGDNEVCDLTEGSYTCVRKYHLLKSRLTITFVNHVYRRFCAVSILVRQFNLPENTVSIYSKSRETQCYLIKS